MKDFLFSEYITQQSIEFSIMFFAGTMFFILYFILRRYLFAKIRNHLIAGITEILFFATGAFFTACVIDYCCNARLTPYMVIAFLLGLPVSAYVIKK